MTDNPVSPQAIKAEIDALQAAYENVMSPAARAGREDVRAIGLGHVTLDVCCDANPPNPPNVRWLTHAMCDLAAALLPAHLRYVFIHDFMRADGYELREDRHFKAPIHARREVSNGLARMV